MAQVIAVSVYKLGSGNRLENKGLYGVPMPAEFIPVPVATQPEQSNTQRKVFTYVYSRIRYGIGATSITEDLYSTDTVDQLITKANA